MGRWALCDPKHRGVCGVGFSISSQGLKVSGGMGPGHSRGGHKAYREEKQVSPWGTHRGWIPLSQGFLTLAVLAFWANSLSWGLSCGMFSGVPGLHPLGAVTPHLPNKSGQPKMSPDTGECLLLESHHSKRWKSPPKQVLFHREESDCLAHCNKPLYPSVLKSSVNVC